MELRKYCNKVVSNAKKYISKKTKIKMLIMAIVTMIVLLTGASFEIDQDTIMNFGNQITTEDFKNQMVTMKSSGVANEVITGLRSFNSVDYEFSIPVGEENDKFVDDITAQMKSEILDYKKG